MGFVAIYWYRWAMAYKAKTFGPTAHTVAANIRTLRTLQGMTQADLSAALADRGHEVPELGVRRWEKAQRVVTVDDLTALSLALDCSPAALLVPLPGRDGWEGMTEVTGHDGEVTPESVWRWVTQRTAVAPAVKIPGADVVFHRPSATTDDDKEN